LVTNRKPESNFKTGLGNPGVTVVIGAQWGDEGKGKLVDLLSSNADVVCRCQGGNNAGHTVMTDGKKYFFHILPSGVINPRAVAVIGNGTVVNLPALFEVSNKNGLKDLENRLKISNRCHLVFEFHQLMDGLEIRGNGLIGTTKKGIGPAYSSKVTRNGLRMCDLVGDWDEFVKKYTDLVNYVKRRYPKLEINVQESLEVSHCPNLIVFWYQVPFRCTSVHFIFTAINHTLSCVFQAVSSSVNGRPPYITLGGHVRHMSPDGLPRRAIFAGYGSVFYYTKVSTVKGVNPMIRRYTVSGKVWGSF
uniref:Adenylosuccinate synthetase n=1 Tax=Echinostoma caproni TaxID=27848 RepID=A0A183A2T5_9TREM